MAKGRMGSNPSVLLKSFIHHYFSIGNNFLDNERIKKSSLSLFMVAAFKFSPLTMSIKTGVICMTIMMFG